MRVAFIILGCIALSIIASFLYGWWILCTEKPTDMWRGEDK
jgi:hypothetical protein